MAHHWHDGTPLARWHTTGTMAHHWHDGTLHSADMMFKAKADALAWLSTVETDLLRGAWVAPANSKATFDEFAEGWLEIQHHLRPRTVGAVPLPFALPPGALLWRSLAVGDQHDGCAGLAPISFRPPAGTAPKAYRLLAQLMKVAVNDNYIVRSPVAVKGASKEAAQEQAVPTVAEVEVLSKAVPERYETMVLLAAWCALRFGELAALRRDRVDLVHNEIRVSETVTELGTGDRFAGPPKTAAGRRTVAVPPHLLPIIKQHLQRVGPEPDALLFPHRRAAMSAAFISASACGSPRSR